MSLFGDVPRGYALATAMVARSGRLVAQSVVALVAVTFWLMGTMTIVTFHRDQTALQSVLTLLHR